MWCYLCVPRTCGLRYTTLGGFGTGQVGGACDIHFGVVAHLGGSQLRGISWG